ncbi:hypothetical protein EVAR_16811_1 [Eumeta japonica]|uniref:STE20-like serine/threonine-protein kinase n=1 Tax=Eumeta variegata TaxID=151549 RepID=A0A4C1V2A9_EUMVA|nr:hypothetical protein EVAR_16811_1 [Eumeta japonica]
MSKCRFEAEHAALLRAHEAELEALARVQRAAAERAEQQLDAELRAATKRLRADQERDLRHFRDGLKQELRLLKQEVELVPKDRRKEAYKQRRQRLDTEHAERETAFVAALVEAHDAAIRRIHENHCERQALVDRQYLQQRQQIMRTREAALCELEEKQIHERHQLAKRQLKEEFLLRRHQMLNRHEKEIEQIKRKNSRKEEEVLKCQAAEKRSLPKRIRAEMKAREMMFRESLRISTLPPPGAQQEDERERLKKFQENEKRRYRAEQQRLATKHAKAREELKAAGDALLRELEQYQNEKRKALTTHETAKMKAFEERYAAELRKWRATLGDRKQVRDRRTHVIGAGRRLLQAFSKQLDDHEKKFGKKIPDRTKFLDAPWPKNVLHHVLAVHQQRNSLIGSLSRSRTSLHLLGVSSTPTMERRRSISPVSRGTKSAATSAYNTTKRGKLSKAQHYASTSNLKLVSEKISNFSVFAPPEINREPILAYGDIKKANEPKMRVKTPAMKEAITKAKINRQSMSEHLLKQHNKENEESSGMKRSISQLSLKKDREMEAVMIDLPSLEDNRQYDTIRSLDSGSIDLDGDSSKPTTNFSRWGPVRGSNSYSNSDVPPVSQLSTLNLRRSIASNKSARDDSAV